jgi:hypothetical protein
LFTIVKIAFVYPASNFFRFNVKIFQHVPFILWKLSITKAKSNAMEEKCSLLIMVLKSIIIP